MMTSSSTLCPVCPVCLEDIEDPVVLPCRHEVCKVCFCATVAVATVCCPLCRKRMSSWARKNARDPVNKFRKAEIERNRLEARVDSCTRAAIVPNCLSQPGDIKKEYLLELEKVEEEKREEAKRGEDEAERLQGEELSLLQMMLSEKECLEVQDQRMVDSLLAEELQLEDKRAQQMKEDEDIARKLCEEFKAQGQQGLIRKAATSPRQSSNKKKLVKHHQTRDLSCKPLTHWFKPAATQEHQ